MQWYLLNIVCSFHLWKTLNNFVFLIITETKVFLQCFQNDEQKFSFRLLCVGVIAVIWSIMWFFLVYNSPAEHPRISGEERNYIEKALNKKGDAKV